MLATGRYSGQHLSILNDPTVGPKTRAQLMSERHMVRQIMLSMLTAPADKDLAPEARPFAHGLARHCALLIAADETGSAHG